jgi:Polyketide cyclase / dehydrase and lipid transport
MPMHQVSVSADINAPASKIYAILADYHEGHPRIMPRPPFGFLKVEQGGVGEGTVISFSMTLNGRTRVTRGQVTEPQPGTVLVETYPDSGAVTSFTVEPNGDSPGTRVTIATDIETRGGLLGVLERFLITRTLRHVYERQLRNLAAEAEQIPPNAPVRAR